MKSKAPYLYLCLFLFGITILLSCEKVLIKDPEDDPKTNFEEMWRILDERYPYFTYKKVDWDAMYYQYGEHINEQMSDPELFDTLSEMLFELQDGHVSLKSEFDVSNYQGWYSNYPRNFSAHVIREYYLKNDYYLSGPLFNKIIDSVGYIYYGSFSSTIAENQIDFVIDRFKDLKAVIIDVRNNGGGNTENITMLASRFADKRRHAYDILFKNGRGHDDFYTASSYYIEPLGNQQFTRSVYILTNRSCYSSTTQFIQVMRTLPHVTIVGDTCGGGGGTPISHELPNGWIFNYSSDMAVAPDGFNIEHGIPPDIYVSMDSVNAANGVDDIIERALREVK